MNIPIPSLVTNRHSIVNGSSLPPAASVLHRGKDARSILVLTPDVNRYQKLSESFSPLGLSGYQIPTWSQLAEIIRKRAGKHRLVIIDADQLAMTAVDMTYVLRSLDPQLSILVLGYLSKHTQRSLENQGGILTSRANPIRSSSRLAIGRLLAHHHVFEKLRAYSVHIASYAA